MIEIEEKYSKVESIRSLDRLLIKCTYVTSTTTNCDYTKRRKWHTQDKIVTARVRAVIIRATLFILDWTIKRKFKVGLSLLWPSLSRLYINILAQLHFTIGSTRARCNNAIETYWKENIFEPQ